MVRIADDALFVRGGAIIATLLQDTLLAISCGRGVLLAEGLLLTASLNQLENELLR
jgi:hypothetical protein